MNEKDYDKLKQIEQAIQDFNSKKLYESSLTLYKALDYQSSKTERISPASFDGLIDSFNLPKNSINKEKAYASHWKQVEFIFQVADSEITRVQSLFDTGEVDRNEYQSFLFFTIHLKEESYKRSDLVKITRELNVPFKMPVIVLFHYGSKLTLSIIDRRLNKKDSSKDVLEKVTLIKDIDIANPQRAHKEILKDLSLNELYKKFEFHSFVKLHEAWKATLNISELNKKFYKELAYWYFWALKEVKFPDDELKDDETRNPINVIRLITRLVFVWFLKEKNLIPDEIFSKRELDKVLDYKDKTGSTYYKAILQNLFFATLNTEMNKDVKDKNKISRTFVNRNTGVPHYFRYSRFIKDQEKFAQWMDNIPFLNGGLFECLDKRTKEKDIYIDGFTQQVKNENLVTVPDYLFFSDAPRNIDLNSTFHTKGKKYEVRGLIDILSRYKFTIEENTPVEEEVALDPELLGKVFENLLASYIEETKTTARKLTGSFYTPREIVNYMVDESLITYLCNRLIKEEDDKKREDLNIRLRHLFSYTAEEPLFTDAEKKELVDAIDTCKILDPACGSGAFPMGILHKLVFILSKLDPKNKRWKQKQQDKAKRDRLLAEEMEDEKNREASIKEIDKRIEDIEKAFDQNNHELDFGRKLYLIENCIYGVDNQAVAIQISKLRFFIALVVDQKTANDSEPNRGIRPLPNLETKFVAADTLVSVEKPEQLTLMNQDEDLQEEIREKEVDIHRVREKHFRARTPETKEKYRLLDAQHRDELAKLLQKDGFPKEATKKLAGWNPYDQNRSADFFDPMWMFEIDKGFDIVIGNPPYGIKFTNKEKEYLRKKFPELEFKIDSYEVFILKSMKLLAASGICTYIIPSNLMDNFFTKKIRHKLLTQSQIIEATELDDKVFEAVVHSMILSFSNVIMTEYQINCRIEKSIDSPITKIPNTFFLNEEHHTFFFRKYLYFDLIKRIYKDCDKLENWLRLKDGIDTGDNKKYISERKIDKNWKKVLGGQDVDRWSIKNFNWIHYGSHLANPRDISIFEQEKILIRETGNRIISTYDDSNFYALSTLYIGNLISKKIGLKSVLCLLNSDLYHFLMYLIAFSRTEGAFTKTRIFHYYGLPVPNSIIKSDSLLSRLCECILFVNNKENDVEESGLLSSQFENVINGCVYELYFGEEMKKAGVDILTLVEKDLEVVKKLSQENAIAKLYEKWQEPNNEVRNRLLLMATRCPDTIGVIEASVL